MRRQKKKTYRNFFGVFIYIVCLVFVAGGASHCITKDRVVIRHFFESDHMRLHVHYLKRNMTFRMRYDNETKRYTFQSFRHMVTYIPSEVLVFYNYIGGEYLSVLESEHRCEIRKGVFGSWTNKFYGMNQCYMNDDLGFTIPLGVYYTKDVNRIRRAVQDVSSIMEYQFNVKLNITYIQKNQFRCMDTLAHMLDSFDRFIQYEKQQQKIPSTYGWLLFTNCSYQDGKKKSISFQNGISPITWLNQSQAVINQSNGIRKSLAHSIGHLLGMSHTDRGIGCPNRASCEENIPRFNHVNGAQICTSIERLRKLI